MSERFKVVLDHARRYTSAQLYLLPFTQIDYKTKEARHLSA